MKTFLRRILYWVSIPIRALWGFNKGFKLYYLRGLQWEEEELENVFALLLLGSYVRLPNPPVDISYRLLPYMLREMYIMQEKSLNPLTMKTGWLNV
ncbi:MULTISPECIES: hypothetical protein [Thermococcus]|uniref:Uncharacterized protein n=1 Tax=Thermococcus sibiricus (strain DSM 12597 / MM 739) TaxID=604354 RepID=C6A105_THESM|nr:MULTISPECIES: hypothetical protein [Thermococcus]KUJ98388.1 MAG: Uncharacterized protein XD43_1949 [Thermococcales archaeon 44_46]HIH73444.1 hypothetical protein [Thermococcaceae archaeon]ACS89300.1 hypothetical protein TSIB_0233 [Thermococcus sibiricus MM 739]MBC7095181.1 hypothetical protein [Thermococcus sp.]HII67631.1 hypothetical protein [Thermococcaceae archaeon]